METVAKAFSDPHLRNPGHFVPRQIEETRRQMEQTATQVTGACRAAVSQSAVFNYNNSRLLDVVLKTKDTDRLIYSAGSLSGMLTLSDVRTICGGGIDSYRFYWRGHAVGYDEEPRIRLKEYRPYLRWSRDSRNWQYWPSYRRLWKWAGYKEQVVLLMVKAESAGERYTDDDPHDSIYGSLTTHSNASSGSSNAMSMEDLIEKSKCR